MKTSRILSVGPHKRPLLISTKLLNKSLRLALVVAKKWARDWLFYECNKKVQQKVGK